MKYWLGLLGLFALISIVVVVAWHRLRPVSVDRLRAADVRVMHAYLARDSFRDPIEPREVGPYEVRPEDYESVLQLFRNGAVERHTASWQVLGTVFVMTHNGERVRIDLFWTGDARSAFRIDRTYYRGASDDEAIS